MSALLSHYKTTIAGILAGALQLYANGTDLKHCLLSLALAAAGIVAKDFNK